MPDTRPRTNLQLRVLTALVGIPVLLGGIYFSAYGFGFIVAGISVLCLQEFYGVVTRAGGQPSLYAGLALGLMALMLAFCTASGLWPLHLWLLIVPGLALVLLAKLYHHDSAPLQSLGYTFFGLFYTVLPFVLFIYAGFVHGQYQYQIPMGILFLLWASDTGAYFAGRALGKTKLFERHSPKKTWEGFAGGALSVAVVCGILSIYFTSLPAHVWAMVGLLVLVAGTGGDLVESMFKRSLQLKDSGSLLPGHGGFLDRFDGLLLALPFICTLLLLLA